MPAEGALVVFDPFEQVVFHSIVGDERDVFLGRDFTRMMSISTSQEDEEKSTTKQIRSEDHKVFDISLDIPFLINETLKLIKETKTVSTQFHVTEQLRPINRQHRFYGF